MKKVDKPLNAEEKDLVKKGGKVKAMKSYKDRTGCSLSEARTVVEGYRKTLHSFI